MRVSRKRLSLPARNAAQRQRAGDAPHRTRRPLNWNSRRCIAALGWIWFVVGQGLPDASGIVRADEPLPRVIVVLFTPSDVTPPANAAERLNEIANYTEKFLVYWMKHWGYPPAREQIFDRDERGKLLVRFVRGQHSLASGKYQEANFGHEVWDAAISQYKLGRHRHVWWTWVYLGDPPLRFTSFEGSGNVRQGGNAYTNYTNLPGRVSLEAPLGSELLTELTVKGAMHELGHALGLPHGGPRGDLNLGMPLMGANIPNYRARTKTQEMRAYLTPASAAMLWKHPVFSGTAEHREVLPRVRFANLAARYHRTRREAHLTGVLQAERPAHSIVVLDNVPDVHEAYWQKPYVSRVAADGSFDVVITEPSRIPGTLRLLACFDNGAVTGDGMKYGIQGVFEIPYAFDGSTYKLHARLDGPPSDSQMAAVPSARKDSQTNAFRL